MSRQPDAIRRALDALEPGQHDLHPGHETLEAYVEGRLTPEQRAAVDRIAAQSRVVAEDLADLQAIHETLAPAAVGRRDIRWNRMAAAAGVAAAIVAAVWIGWPARVHAPTRTVQLSADEATRVQAAIDAGRISVPGQIQSLRAVTGTLLGESRPATFTVQAPIGTLVASPRPIFEWQDAAADSYTIAVFDTAFSEVARADVKTTTWQPTVDLPRGVTLSWQVTAHRGATNDTEPKPPRPEARFAIVDAATADAVTQMQARLANDPLQLGILLAERGLLLDARQQLMRAGNRAETATVARRLIDSIDQGTPTTTKPAQ